jgi:hypothetical protein
MARGSISPPSGYEDVLSRKQAARLLGFGSEFKVRQLEKQGRLQPVRGAMGSAWYPRRAVEALRQPDGRRPAPSAKPAGQSDAALIAHLREAPGDQPRTVVDLVADLGVSISRAERVYRFWLKHDAHPSADAARAAREGRPQKFDATPPLSPAERRSHERLERDTLLKRMRDPDPRVRADAFEKLKPKRG